MTTPPSPAEEMLELAAKATPGPLAIVHCPQDANECYAVKAQPNSAMRGFTMAIAAFYGPLSDQTALANAEWFIRSRTLAPLLAQQVVELTVALEKVDTETAELIGLLCAIVRSLPPHETSVYAMGNAYWRWREEHKQLVDDALDAAASRPRSALAGKPQTEQKP